MINKKNIHIAMSDKFLPPLIDFIYSNFSKEKNKFYLYGQNREYDFLKNNDVSFLDIGAAGVSYYQLLKEMYNADKIILHSLFSQKIIKILFFNPWLLKKCYWLMWGGDLYSENQGLSFTHKKYKSFVIKNMGYLLTYIPGDIEYARERFKAKGCYIENIGYLSNVCNVEVEDNKNNKENIHILLGNSATESNEHIEALDILAKFKNSNIKIYVPLSYGNSIYANQVIEYGKSIFNEKFIALTSFQPYEQYQRFLQSIDIAIFNHKRQQAMGNTINLLGMGKKVYLRKGTSQWDFFNINKIKIFDVEDFDIDSIYIMNENSKNISEKFSMKKLESHWRYLLNE